MKALKWVIIGLVGLVWGCGRVTQFASPSASNPEIVLSARLVDHELEASVTSLTDRRVVFPRSRVIYRVEFVNQNNEGVEDVPVIGLAVSKTARVGPTLAVTDSVELPEWPADAVSVRVSVSAQLEDGTVLILVQDVSRP